jgi:hypothetical protein
MVSVMRKILILCMLIALSSCARFRIHRTSKPAETEAFHESIQHSIAWGFHSLSRPTSIKDVCKDGWEDIEMDVQFTRALLHVVTVNFYSPWNVTISCAKSRPKPKDFFSKE